MDSWDQSYLLDAMYWASRSHDPQTQVGCTLVAPDNTPISHGYNGFIRGIDNSKLPNTRPGKYPYMIHAEMNAIYNACRQGKSTMGATAYITSEPCIGCRQGMWQVGIVRVIYCNISKPKMLDEKYEVRKKLLMEVMNPRLPSPQLSHWQEGIGSVVITHEKNIEFIEIPPEEINLDAIEWVKERVEQAKKDRCDV